MNGLNIHSGEGLAMTMDASQVSTDLPSDGAVVAAPKSVWSAPVLTLFDVSMGEAAGDTLIDSADTLS